MKNRWKKLIAKCLVLSMVLGLLPNTGLNVKAASEYEPQENISMEAVKNKGLPVINLDMEDPNEYNNLKGANLGLKEKKNIKKFTLYDEKGNDITPEKDFYPMTAKGRGNSSWTMKTGKKPYNLKFEKKVDLLGMGEAKSWCIVSNWVDTSYMRNYMAYNLACEMGMGTPDCRQVALCINGRFEGIYLLTEKVGLNDYRTEVPESPEDADVNGDNEKTEIIIESDSRAYTNAEPGAFTTKGGVYFVPKDPERPDLTDSAYEEIKKEVNAMEAAILSGDNYKDYIDVDSWVDTYIINELAKNPDFGFGNQPCYSSSYLYFREGGKVYAGPVWDFDIGYGRNDYSKMGAEGNRETANPEGYLTASTKYYKELIEKTDFMEYVVRRWKQLKADGTLDNWIGINGTSENIYKKGHDEVKGLVQQDLAAWGGTDVRVAGTFDVGRKAYDFEQECTYIKSFIQNRINWLDTQWNVDEWEVAYSDGEWAREEVTTAENNPSYNDLINGNISQKVVWDGGHGFIENKEAVEKELGKSQGAIPGVKINPITLKLDLSEITENNQACAKWVAQGEGGGFGPGAGQGSNPERKIEESGRYIGMVAKSYWVNVGNTYNMGQQEEGKFYRVYVVDVGTDGAITLHDGTVNIPQSGPWEVESVDENKHCGTLEKTSDSYTLKYQADGNGNYKVPGTGAAVDMKLSVVDGGSQNLTVTKRAIGTKYPEVLDSFESTYIKVTDGMPEGWTNSNPEVVAFDEVTRKVTALKAGTATITTKAGTQNVSLTFTVTEKQATELSKTENPEEGLYAEGYSRKDAPAKGTWATAASNQIYRFTYKLDLTDEQFKKMNSIYLANGEKEQVLSGQGDYYIYVNGTPWVKADAAGTISNFADNYKFTTNFGNDDKANLEQANAALRDLMQAGENTIDIFMISASNAYMDKPYFFGTKAIGEEDPEKPIVEVTDVTLDTANAEMIVGSVFKLNATITPIDATNKKLTWTSSDATVATVSNGIVTAVAPGEVTITATSNNGISATAAIKVMPKPPVVVEQIVLDKTEVSLFEGETEQLTATVSPSDAVDKTLTWTSSNENIAAVDSNGKITAIAQGTATITVTAANGVFTTATVIVSKKPVVEVQSVTLDKTEASLIEGKTVQLQATIIPSNATNQELTWKTSDKKVATVDATGKVTAIAPGTAIITVTSVNKKSATATITVTKKPDIGNGATMELSFASREAFENSETPETVVEKGIALLDEENGGLKQYETNETENELARMANQILYKEKALKANENSKKKGNANAEYNSNKNGNNGKNHKDDSASDKVEILPNNEGVLLWSGESMAFAAKDYDATQQILYVDAPNTTGAELTFVTPGSEPQKLEINDGEVILPEVQKREDGYAYYLIANTGSQSITLKNIWADKELEWEVSYGTLPVMYEMNAVAFEKDILEITYAELEVDTVKLRTPVNFTIKTTANKNVDNLIVRDRFYEDGLYGELTKELDTLNNEIVWNGQIRPGKLTSTVFTFAAVDEQGNVSVNPVKLTIKVTRR